MNEPTFENLQAAVLQWAKDRKIIPNSTPNAQFLKACSEFGELADGIAKRDQALIEDSVGDVLVCLINFCALSEIDLVGCLAGAYAEIKDRKGTLTPEGIFVKEAP